MTKNSYSRRTFLGTATAATGGFALTSIPGVSEWLPPAADADTTTPSGPYDYESPNTPPNAKVASLEHPNIIWICSDEHNWTVTNCYQGDSHNLRPNDFNGGPSGLKYDSPTPNIDALSGMTSPNADPALASTVANRVGVIFDKHYCNSPVCCPSRASITTCRYPSQVGVYGNNEEIDLNGMDQIAGTGNKPIQSIANVLYAAGYSSFLCGKQHYERDRRYGFHAEDTFNQYLPAGSSILTQNGGFNDYGKSGIESRNYFVSEAQANSGTGPGFDPDKDGLGRLTGANVSQDGDSPCQHDTYVTSCATQWLNPKKSSNDASSTTPLPNNGNSFFMFVGFLAPHFSYTTPAKNLTPYLSPNYTGDPHDFTGQTCSANGQNPCAAAPEPLWTKISAPAEVNAGSLAPNYQVEQQQFGLSDPETEQSNLTTDLNCNTRAIYYGRTQWMDERVAEVINSIPAAVLANTVIIYSTDHGENMGEHGLWFKNCMFDSATHVPLIMSFPGGNNPYSLGGVTNNTRMGQVSSHVDLVQTIANIAGVTTPPSVWKGQQMMDWIRSMGPNATPLATPWKDFAYSEYYAEAIASGMVMWRSGSVPGYPGDWKYVYHIPGQFQPDWSSGTIPVGAQAVNYQTSPFEELYYLGSGSVNAGTLSNQRGYGGAATDLGEFTNLLLPANITPKFRSVANQMAFDMIAEIQTTPSPDTPAISSISDLSNVESQLEATWNPTRNAALPYKAFFSDPSAKPPCNPNFTTGDTTCAATAGSHEYLYPGQTKQNPL